MRETGCRLIISLTTNGWRIKCVGETGGVGCADAFDKSAAGVRGGIPARDRGDCSAAPIRARAGRAGFALVGRDSSRAARVD